MNIFVSHPNPTKCAIILDDKRLVKMVLETAQLLSTSISMMNGNAPYKITHKNHPCAVWVRACQGNYVWTLKHFIALCDEYQFRYNKIHKCREHLNIFKSSVELFDVGVRTNFVNCTPFKDNIDVHDAYRKCLIDKWEKDYNPRWTRREKPTCFDEFFKLIDNF